MTKKWCLVKASDGERGLNGKKKIYEITLEDSKVTFSWGMAEKPNKQTQVVYLSNSQAAQWAAVEKLHEKEAKGYRLAYVA